MRSIEAPYACLIRGNILFWIASEIEVDIGAGGIEVDTGRVGTFVQAGIQLATPDSAPAAEGDHFALRDTADDDWREWLPELR